MKNQTKYFVIMKNDPSRPLQPSGKNIVYTGDGQKYYKSYSSHQDKNVGNKLDVLSVYSRSCISLRRLRSFCKKTKTIFRYYTNTYFR